MSEKKEMSGAACAGFMAVVMLGMGASAVVLDRVVMPALDEMGHKMAGAYQQFENSLKHNSLG